MASEMARELRQQGITAAKSGNKEEARQLLQQSIRLEPNNEAAWLWLASVARDAEERRFCLEKLLEINPHNETALKALGSLPADNSPIKRIGNETAKAQTSEFSAPVRQPSDAAQQAPSVPAPTPEKIAEAQRQIERIITESTIPLPNDVNYTRKTKRRAGESDIVVYRFYLGAAAAGVFALFIVFFIILVSTNDDVAEIVLGASPTITQTPTATWTPTPGFTPTPSLEPNPSYTPSPAVPTEIPFADIHNPPRPTAIYPQLQDRAMLEAVAAVYQGNVTSALSTLDAARELSEETLFDAVPYYYQAIALIQRGENNRALTILQDGQTRRDEEASTSREAQAILDAGFVQVYDALARQATTNGDNARATQYNELMLEHAESAINGNPRIAAPYLISARYLHARNNNNEALRVLNQGLNEPSLRGNVDLFLTKAQIYADDNDYGDADYQAYLALYVDPANEPAHLLRIELAMAQDRPAQAVIFAQEYLMFYPGSRLGFQLLGDAHYAEGSYELAIFAYSRGLTAPDQSQATVDLYVGRGQAYMAQRQYHAAQEDFTAALEIQNAPAIQALRMEAAYHAGDYETVIADGEALTSAAGVTQWRVALFAGRALIDSEAEAATNLDQALVRLQAATTGAPVSERAIAYEYIALAHLRLGEIGAAREAINTALNAGDSAHRRYINGLILEEEGETAAAIRNYQWALTLSEIVPYSGDVDIEERLAQLT